MPSPTPPGSAIHALRWLASAASSPTATVLIAVAFLCAPVKVALSLAPPLGSEPVESGFASCEFSHKISRGDTLTSVSSLYFGDPGYGWAILVATNMKDGSPPYKFVAKPFELPVGLALCVPNDRDAATLKQRYDSYLKAGHGAMLVEPPERSHPLVSLEPGRAVTLVTWVRQSMISSYQGARNAPRETWVTVVPKLKTFCEDYVRQHDPNPAELALRLEQRLGLPPGSNNVALVEFRMMIPPTFSPDILFRPCGDPRIDATECHPKSPPPLEEFNQAPDAKRWYWFLNKYYASYGVASPYQYPWTAAGYTFDWATKEEDDQQFAKWGESEFVVGMKAPIEVLSITDTVAYCATQ